MQFLQVHTDILYRKEILFCLFINYFKVIVEIFIKPFILSVKINYKLSVLNLFALNKYFFVDYRMKIIYSNPLTLYCLNSFS